MERDLIVERTQAGLARAKAEGKLLDGLAKTTPDQRTAMIEGYRQEKRECLNAAIRRVEGDRSNRGQDCVITEVGAGAAGSNY
ncbi:recombinase family protein [Rugamonas sp. A1-17]|nr:recombinase family protein [Rugamonas sp. A1-17]